MNDIKTMIILMMNQKDNSLPDNMDSIKSQDLYTEVPDNKRASPL